MKTNHQLQQDVTAELADDPSLDTTHIGVIVDQGVVTLTGHVSSFLDKWHAERAAQRVHGVNALVINLDVQLSAFHERDDADIARSAKNALDCLSQGIREHVMILVDDGWITLSGTVDWQYQRLSAAQAMRHVAGVRGLNNQINIKPQVIASHVQRDIEAAIARHASINAKRIHVEVHGNEVILSGIADSWAEREAALHAAWAVPGVYSVSDKDLIT
jgi:osmotically-inducible protein OsmY